MRRRAGLIGVAGIVCVAVAVVVWQAWNVSYERIPETPCAYYPGNCTFIVAVPTAHFRMIP